MIQDQSELIEVSLHSVLSPRDKVDTNNRLFYFMYAPQDIRLAEGVLVLIKDILGANIFDWNSGYDSPLLQTKFPPTEKEKISSHPSICFLATYNSINNDNLLKLLEFASVIGKPIYIIPTKYGDTTFGESFTPDYNYFYFEKLRQLNKKQLKLKVPKKKNILYTITSVDQLK